MIKFIKKLFKKKRFIINWEELENVTQYKIKVEAIDNND